MTVLDLITRAMRLLNAVNVGDGPTAPEEQAGLLALNAMVDAWATERLMLFTTTRGLVNIVAGQQNYAIGPSNADWIAPRPPHIDAAGLIVVQSDPTQNYERPLHVIRSNREWARVRMKGLGVDLPFALYYQPDFPNGTVTIYPAPTENNQLALYTPVAVTQFTGLTQTISLPPGYARALPYNLAVELAPEFDREPSAVVVAIAQQSKADIKRVNAPYAIGKLRAGREYRSGGGVWDWTIGEER
jgi:hypothetical protein